MASDDESGNFLARGKKFLSKAKFSNDSKSPRSATIDSPSEDVPDAEQSAYQRRRAQVRRAQRSHRERKQNYVRDLEIQVESLRKYYTPKVEAFESEVAFLRQYILAHGLELPVRPDPNQPHPDFQVQNPVDVTFGGFGEPGSMLKVQMPNAPNWGDWTGPVADPAGLSTQSGGFGTMNQQQQPQQPQQQQRLGAVPAHLQHQQQQPQLLQQHPTGQSVYQNHDQTFNLVDRSHMSNLQIAQYSVAHNAALAQFAMDFILTLEHVCTSHLLADPKQNGGVCQASDGHAMCASTQLFAMAQPNLDFNSGDTQWRVPASAIDNLLALSSELDINVKEITPVQAWNRLRSHPAFARASIQQLQQLTLNLDKETKCEGFGAVIDSEFFEWSLNHFLGKNTNIL